MNTCRFQPKLYSVMIILDEHIHVEILSVKFNADLCMLIGVPMVISSYREKMTMLHVEGSLIGCGAIN